MPLTEIREYLEQQVAVRYIRSDNDLVRYLDTVLQKSILQKRSQS